MVSKPADCPDSAGSDRVRADDAPKLSEESFRTLIEALPDAVLVHRRGRVVYANQAAVRMHGYDDVESMLGVEVVALVHPEEHSVVAQRIEEISEAGRPFPLHESRLLRRDGTAFTAEITGLAVTFQGEAAIAAVANDVTEKHRIMSQLAQRDRLASMGLLAASVAHEVNNPITYVLLNLERLSKEMPAVGNVLGALRDELGAALGEEQADAIFRQTGASRLLGSAEGLVAHVTTAVEGARQVGRIARDLTAFARVDDDERAGVDVNVLLDKVADVAANELRFRAHVVREYGALPAVVANESRLSQVFLNLILNAAHAIDEGAPDRNCVCIATSQEGREVRVSVSDTGRGIAPENLPRLFEPFFTTKARGLGSGLGLSICRDIVQSHGGRIEVQSTPEKGSRFTVYLPIGVGAEGSGQPPPSVQVRAVISNERPRILVIDDERTLRATLETLLEDRYEVVLAESGEVAFRILEQDRQFDAILCDLMMPETSGMQVHAWVQREIPSLLVRMVFMTGGAFTRNASEFLEQIQNRHIDKPFEVHELVDVLDRTIRKGAALSPAR